MEELRYVRKCNADPQSTTPASSLPRLWQNILAEGFYNSCTETTRLREENYPLVIEGKLLLEHDEDNFTTIEHECDLEAYCSSCKQLLPWALHEIRGLDGVNLSEADTVIAKLLADLPEKSQEGAT